MKFNLARCSNKLVFGSDSNFPNGFFFAVLVVPGIARGWSSSSKIDGFGSGHFHGCLYQGGSKTRHFVGYLMLTIGSELCHEVQGCFSDCQIT